MRKRGFELRKQLAAMRRVVDPMHDVVARLGRNDLRLFAGELAPYFQDVQNNVSQATGKATGARERVADILAASMEEQTNQLNEITKKLAAWAAIVGIPTAITGFYGQNVPYPGLGHRTGFVVSAVLIVILAVGLYLVLKRRRWL